MNGPVVVDEPFGHRNRNSKIERAWKEMPPGTGLIRRRTERYDAVGGVFYAPMQYEHPYLIRDLPVQSPDEKWVEENFLSFVRGEFGPGSSKREKPSSLTVKPRKESIVGIEFLRTLLTKSEAPYYVPGGPIDEILTKRREDMAGAIYDILCDPRLGHKKNASNLPLDDLRKTLNDQVARRDRLVLVLPAFPFKDQNRFRTYSGASTVDLGELALLIRLHCLALALYQVHPFGADIVVLSDGELYADIFGIDLDAVRRYKDQLFWFRNHLNLQGTVSILDLADLINRFDLPKGGDSAVARCRAAIRQIVSSYRKREDVIGDTFKVLLRGMKWNLNTRDFLKNLEDPDAWIVATEMDEPQVPARLLSTWKETQERALNAAVEYASVNLMLRYLELVGRVFPGALRGTVHPKPGQVAISIAGGLYPWNGVATAPKGQTIGVDVQTVAVYELAQQSVDLVRLDITRDPLYFEVER